MYGANTNDGDEITNAMRFLCTRPADAGSCVITIDHLPKSAEARTTGYAIGSIAKKRMIRGSYLRAEPTSRPAPGQARPGDPPHREGHRRRVSARRPAAGTPAPSCSIPASLRPTASPGGRWSLQAMPKNDDGTFRPTEYMERISRYVEDNDQCSGRDIQEACTGSGKGTTKFVRDALRLLIHEGFITTIPGPRNAILHHSVMHYRKDEDDHA
ncbi:hypothetical protein G5V59_02655 [Nocardioides sp. W3-2-3]|uniref:hypothetical protein n=1 Tax=Nocardioides convexus TaxID=2712224 RepID=UPI0024187DCF|nr:hypothetical protein [Nocardioides convexus]NGZ99653.1 hypothetical protein [Nocardioides convexus]